MRVLDLYCGAGGAGVGYSRAGHEVVGVDIDPQPDYPFPMCVADALAGDPERIAALFDAVHASPPCQAYTTMSNRNRGDWPDLIAPTRELLEATGLPYVIENVPGAKAELIPERTHVLHGGMFGLQVYRPRLFEVHGFDYTPPPAAAKPANPLGVYGRPDGRRLWTRADGTEQRAWTFETGCAAMGIDWVTDPARWHDIAEAIPPAYTQHIGAQL